MPIKTIRRPELDLTEHIVSGDIKDDDMFACEKEFYANNPTQKQLWDMSEAKLNLITVQGMRHFLKWTSEQGKVRAGGKTAVYVRTKLQYGLGRMSEILIEIDPMPFAFRVFQDRDKALEWLNS